LKENAVLKLHGDQSQLARSQLVAVETAICFANMHGNACTLMAGSPIPFASVD
jgi:hypothetical protein